MDHWQPLFIIQTAQRQTQHQKIRQLVQHH